MTMEKHQHTCPWAKYYLFNQTGGCVNFLQHAASRGHYVVSRDYFLHQALGFGKAYLRNYVQVCKIRWLMQMADVLSKVSARSQWRLLRTSYRDSWQPFQIQLKSPSFPLIPVINIWFIFLEVLHADWNSVEVQSPWCLQHPHFKRKGNFINDSSHWLLSFCISLPNEFWELCAVVITTRYQLGNLYANGIGLGLISLPIPKDLVAMGMPNSSLSHFYIFGVKHTSGFL